MSNNKKILYISYDGMTDPLGQSQVLPYLVALSEKGYRFTILSFEKKDRFQKERKIIEEITDKAGINWVPLTFTKNPPIIAKIYDRWKMKRTVIRLFKKHQFEMTHCRSYIAAEMGLMLKKKYGTKFFFDMRGFWAEEKVDCGQWNQNIFFYRQVYRFYKQKEREFLLQADAIVSLTQAAKKELLSKPCYQNLQIDVIPCCADLNHFNYLKTDQDKNTALKKSLQISDSNKVISYIGSVSGWYMTKEMFMFFKRLLQKHPEFVMLVMTKDKPEIIIKEAVQIGVPEEKIIVRYSSRNELPDYIGISDCSIFFIRPTFSKIASSPTKHAELMGMGVPIICNDIGDTGSMIEKTQTGLVVKEFSDIEYNRVINQIETVLSISKENIRKAAFEYFDLAKGVETYLAVYKKIISD